MDVKSMVVGVVIGGVVFGGGGYLLASKRAAATGPRQFAGGQFGGQNRGAAGARAGGGFMGGEIIAKDEKSITLKEQNGSTKIILLAESSQISKSTSGSNSDLLVGTNVMVTGEANQDGSLTAQTIQIRPAGQQFPGQRFTQ